MSRYFSTPPIFSAPVSKVDRENGIIHGVTIARVGSAKGHGGYIDKTFLLQIVDNAALKSAGIKARFGHPNMCSQALGTYLGRFKNYSYSAEFTKADLFLDETAKTTPNGDLFTYVLDMAENNPDMFGASIVFEIGESIFLEEEIEGKKIKKEFFRLKDLKATDIVDEPAATEGLFSIMHRNGTLSGAEGFPVIATQFLDENPEILDLIFSKPTSVVEFLSNYITNSKMNLSDKIKQNFIAFLEAFSPPPQSANMEPASDSLPSGESLSRFIGSQGGVLSHTTNLPGEDLGGVLSGQGGVSEPTSISLSSHNSEISSLQAELETSNQKLETLTAELETKTLEIETLNQQLSARPSIPLNVTDPSIGVHSANNPKDETGKEILASMPKDMKRKLTSNTKTID